MTADASWPRPWLAAVLGVVPGLGLLYLRQRQLALSYGLGSVVIVLPVLGLYVLTRSLPMFVLPTWVFGVFFVLVVGMYVIGSCGTAYYIAVLLAAIDARPPGHSADGDGHAAPAVIQSPVGAIRFTDSRPEAEAARQQTEVAQEVPGGETAPDPGTVTPAQCPHCGHDIDADRDLDFCPWCAERFDLAGDSTESDTAGRTGSSIGR